MADEEKAPAVADGMDDVDFLDSDPEPEEEEPKEETKENAAEAAPKTEAAPAPKAEPVKPPKAEPKVVEKEEAPAAEIPISSETKTASAPVAETKADAGNFDEAAGETDGAGEGTKKKSAGIFIQIRDAEKRRLNDLLSDPFIVYNVVTKTRIKGQSKSFDVWRRYSEFDRLHMALLEKYPFTVVPPIPPKDGHMGQRIIADNMDMEFVQRRQAGLEIFLRRCAMHPKIRTDSVFQAFLTADAWNAGNKNLKVEQAKAVTKGAIVNVKLKTRDDRFIDLKNYADSLDRCLGDLVKTYERASQHMKAAAGYTSEYGPIFARWSEYEKELGPVLQNIGNFMDQLVISLNEMLDKEEAEFAAPLREYLDYAGSLRRLVKHIEESQYDHEQMEARQNSKILERDQQKGVAKKSTIGLLKSKIMADAPEVKQAKIHVLEQQIEQGKKDLEVDAKRHQAAIKEALAAIEEFQRQKTRDFRRIFVQYTKTQVAFYGKAVEDWEKLKETCSQIQTSASKAKEGEEEEAETVTSGENEKAKEAAKEPPPEKPAEATADITAE